MVLVRTSLDSPTSEVRHTIFTTFARRLDLVNPACGSALPLRYRSRTADSQARSAKERITAIVRSGVGFVSQSGGISILPPEVLPPPARHYRGWWYGVGPAMALAAATVTTAFSGWIRCTLSTLCEALVEVGEPLPRCVPQLPDLSSVSAVAGWAGTCARRWIRHQASAVCPTENVD